MRCLIIFALIFSSAAYAGPAHDSAATTDQTALAHAFATFPYFALRVLLVTAAIAGCIFVRVHRTLDKRLLWTTLRTRRWTAWLFCVLLTLEVFVLANHILLRKLAVLPWDADAQFFPYQVLVADAARAGR